jgi:hypothetical protein
VTPGSLVALSSASPFGGGGEHLSSFRASVKSFVRLSSLLRASEGPRATRCGCSWIARAVASARSGSGWNLKDRASRCRKVGPTFSVGGGGHSTQVRDSVNSFLLRLRRCLRALWGSERETPHPPRLVAPVENLLRESSTWDPRDVRDPSEEGVAALSLCESRRCESSVESLPRASFRGESRHHAPTREGVRRAFAHRIRGYVVTRP